MGILRLILAISVVFDHTGPIFGYSIIGGRMAVQSFFIISGFYISLILNEKYVMKNNSYFLYLSNRFLRIYPLYYLALILTVLFLISTSQLHIYFQPSFTYVLNIIKQITIFITNDYWFYINKTYDNLIVFPSWSLGIELPFYIIAPFIVKKVRTLLLFIFIGIFLRILLAHIFQVYPGQHINHFFPTEAIFFFIGAFSYRVYLFINKRSTKHFLLISVCFILLTCFYQFLSKIPLRSIVELIYYSILVICIPYLFTFGKKHNFDRKIGDLSYPIYIFHMLCILITGYFGLQTTTNKARIEVLLIIILVSYLLNRYIADPIESIRQSRVVKRKQN
jgi:peptidoglycan/LPS O-acetylase OafA/YrhL